MPVDDVQIVKRNNDYIIAVSDNIYDDSASLSQEEKTKIKDAFYAETVNEMSNALLKDFAKDYKVEVNYNRMGIVD